MRRMHSLLRGHCHAVPFSNPLPQMFQFRFQSLLQVALARRDECQSALLAAVDQWNQIEEQRRQLDEQRRVAAVERQSGTVGVLRLSGLLIQERFEQHLASEDRRLATLAKPLQAEVERCRGALQQANQEVRKLELLREQEHRVWTLRQAKAEQQRLDEQAARAAFPLVKP